MTSQELAIRIQLQRATSKNTKKFLRAAKSQLEVEEEVAEAEESLEQDSEVEEVASEEAHPEADSEEVREEP